MTTSLLFTLLLGCTNPSSTSYTNDFIPISSDQTTRLDFSSDPGTEGEVEQLEALGNMAMRCGMVTAHSLGESMFRQQENIRLDFPTPP